MATIAPSPASHSTSLPIVPSQSQSTTSISAAAGGLTVGTEKDEIWSAILKGVASSKMVHTKNVLVLGDSNCGKSTLIHYLKNDPGPQAPQPETDEVPTASFGVTNNYTPMVPEQVDDDSNTLALGYSFVDVTDEENEAMARLGLYQLGLSAPEYLPLLKFALSSETLADSFVVIALDWTRPWQFLESLQRWLNVLQHAIQEICKEGTVGESWSRGKAVVDELREKVEHYLQSYTEPVNGIVMTASTSTSSIPPASLVTTTTAADQVTLPLTQGCLTTNLGVPLAIVCCKSDALNTLEQTQDYNDDQFDFIQQTLRCICMKYGASLFYTSTLHPYTFHNLRQYILHRVLTTSTKSYTFHLKAQVVERDTVLVPSGWDSWGKIRVLKEGFDCDGVHQGWDADMDALADRQQPGAHGARGFYEEAIPDPDTEEQPLNISPVVVCEDEQVFYERHFDTLQRAPEVQRHSGTGDTATRPSVVGPLGVSHNALDIVRAGFDGNDSGRPSRHKKDSSADKLTLNKRMTNGTNPIDRLSGGNSPAASSPGAVSTSPTVGASSSHEVLANFFQSLITKKTASGGSPGSPTGSSTPASTLLNNAPRTEEAGRRPTRRDVHKELDRIRQYVNTK
ncbi:hypothetical protein EC973_004325 [Apophysomyces ossiformis]|uniref:Dynein light intermediate chain n=1 Tax=Apophysomyces ossiformis TaxID=679940 RepID=A0A8H7BLE1_9FUNG|nr:hypothetical protein EC973_004325 [Apophysomyces ossiformis]